MPSARRVLRVIHRDAGYFVAGLVILYSISGVAVNHIEDWNPNYSQVTSEVDLGPLTGSNLDELEGQVVDRLELDPAEVAGRHRPSPSELVVFLPHGGEVRLDIRNGQGSLKRVATRTLLFESNVLHLNHIKGAWTWISDAFAVVLLFMAISGLLMLKGSTGLLGRGKWFLISGLVIPIGAIIHYYSTR